MMIICQAKWSLCFIAFAALAVACLTDVARAEPQDTAKPEAVDYGPAIGQLKQVIEDELQQETLTGLSIALVDNQRVVLAAGFGMADKEKQKPATAETVYRVGSISKLFTALATMQLVEQGKLDLDAPVQQAVPNLRIVMPFEDAGPITLRQLMCHRSGMVRESPVGGYLDGSGPSMAESIASLQPCVLVNPPNTKTRYSNIGVTIVGQAVAEASKIPFEEYQRENLLDPIGMTHSSWRVDDRVRDQLATSYMRIADDKGGFIHREAPKFELGTIPAGNLYSSANDMALFAKMLLAKGALPEGRIVRPETLAEMSTVQLADNETGFGLGFFAGEYGKRRTIQHTGAVYGFSASLVVLPEAGIAVVVLANEDLVGGRVKRISDAALDLMLAAKTGDSVPTPRATVEMDPEQLEKLTGCFESSLYWAELKMEGDRLTANVAGQPLTLRPIGPLAFEADGRLLHRGTLEFKKDEDGRIVGFHVMGQEFDKVTGDPPEIPADWRKYLGAYGPDFIPLVISERHGHLYAMTENMVDYRLTPVNATVFKLRDGLYADEYLVFEVDADGRVHAATLANMRLPRHP